MGSFWSGTFAPFHIITQTVQVIGYLPLKQFFAQGIFLYQPFFRSFEHYLYAFAFNANPTISIQHNYIAWGYIRSTDVNLPIEFADLRFRRACHTVSYTHLRAHETPEH